MLNVVKCNAAYDGVPALVDVSFNIKEGEIVTLIGSNGTGKSTIARLVSGLIKASSGTIEFCGRRIEKLPAHEIVKLGLVHVPEGRHVFGKLNVKENLLLGAYTTNDEAEVRKRLDLVYKLFPILKERMYQKSWSMSGGQQQMLALGRGLMSNPKLLVLDEPSLGLMPVLCDELFAAIKKINEEGITVMLIEQRVLEALELCDRGYVIQNGRIVMEGTGSELIESDTVKKAYLGM
ncbi:MAG TPA: ABC transporter ATP-binding protein [Bacillota bacterium]|nr:ABC transporter ATP-binding protein [Bacillota bacterium]HOH09621.1 ABC transporter ATP-binding protein [Bacillota bacterium]HPI00905.1 ABC transporter ATP-binding protein [Bacillota bacterium]HPM63513.1 ABC transporter ATP-binding protein [Bacillota bacterium]HQJ24265.1 ABC transporter ATP-binding protein [Bacillota bacterium]